MFLNQNSLLQSEVKSYSSWRLNQGSWLVLPVPAGSHAGSLVVVAQWWEYWQLKLATVWFIMTTKFTLYYLIFSWGKPTWKQLIPPSSFFFQFRDLNSASEGLFGLLNGDDIYNTYTMISLEDDAVAYIYSRIFLYLFLALFIYAVLNLFTSLVISAYEASQVWGGDWIFFLPH